jgi:hypothetical protein
VSIIHSGRLPRLAERLDDLEALGDLLALGLARWPRASPAQLLGELVDVELRLSSSRIASAPMPAVERVVAVLVEQLAVALLGEQLAAADSPVSFGSMTM